MSESSGNGSGTVGGRHGKSSSLVKINPYGDTEEYRMVEPWFGEQRVCLKLVPSKGNVLVSLDTSMITVKR